MDRIGRPVHHHDADREYQHHSLDDRIIAPGDCLVGERAQARQAEQHLHRQRAADQAGQDQPAQRHHRGERIGQQVTQYDARRRQPLGARRADMAGCRSLLQILMQRLCDLSCDINRKDE